MDEEQTCFKHQSTINPNMPLRFLEYLIEVLKKLSYERAKYGSKPLELRDTIFINLYNGKERSEDLYISCISDLIKSKVFKDVCVELKVINININKGHNKELLKLCPILEEYVLFVDEAEKQLAIDREKGLNIAIDNCIRDGILPEYLKENRRGVMGLFLGEYDQNIALEVAREESYDRGRIEGKLEGEMKGYKNTARNLLSMGFPIDDIAKATGLTRAEIQNL